jgi:NDP-sugar pyrophosphorylase family protein
MRAVILAGGKGTRLMPYTTLIPKPLVPIGNEMSILEIIIRQLAKYEFNHITITVNHLSQLIMAFIGDGSKWGLKIDYSLEEKPLSTIGPLTLIDDLPDNFLVMNGDILSNMNYKDLITYHIENTNEFTVATFRRESKIDYGVIKFDKNNEIYDFVEKPIYHFDVSMGVYCANKEVLSRIPKDEKYGFDDLMLDGIKNKHRYKVKPFNGFWFDIGRPEDYDYCNNNFSMLKNKLGEDLF